MNSQWKTLIREAAAVLAAILVAFSLDAWWDGVVERRDMQEALEAVRTEVVTNRVAIDVLLSGNALAQQATMRIALVTEAEIDSMSAEELLELTNAGLQQIFTPERGALTAFVVGGSLSALDDVEVRTAVAGLAGAYAEVAEEMPAMVRAVVDMADAMIRVHGDGRTSAHCLEVMLSSWSDALARDCLRDNVGNDEIVYQALMLTTIFEVHHGELRALRERLEGLDVAIGDELKE